ncbi:flagellar hook assembly protein FlgD [Paraburkholderia sp. LEh10]|uniref:flagellar hook assembly protein FlgD n=1 Tax=Paraburkholderia sp. LEh10 TaxID=2821353 RepID=UPI001AE20959|nr:flagellar hook assembly protein FlgD [Paraburkholderia sp. LEh10]MBP0595953.1 flagellar hook assembly protein FlgD [Paraburkholderia sp. LEh10]
MTTQTTIGNNGATMSQTLLDTMNGTSSSSRSSSGATSGSDLQNTFLQLLIAQMKNQDPTSPMDSSQMTSQLAQINTVTGIGQLNSSLTSLAAQLTTNQQTQAANLISSTVLAPGDSFSVASGKATGFGVTLANDATDVQITVKNASGQVVNTIDLGKQSPGTIPVGWTPVDKSGNALPDGTYTITASSTTASGTGTPATLSAAVVQGIIKQSDGTPGLVLSNGKTVGLSTIAAII